MSDRLRDAAEALRDRHDGSSARAMETELRVLASVAASARARRRRVMWLVPLAAAFAVSTAWAGATGRLRPLVVAAQRMLVPSSDVAPKGTSEPRGESAAPPPPFAAPIAPAPEIAAPADESPAPPAAPRGGTMVKQAPGASARHAPAPATTQAPSPESAVAPVEAAPDPDALYRAAHRAHFVDRDPAAALVAWDRYLAAAPHGALAPEARYDRAIALIRLGRRDEAADALRPFANGEYGPYRQAEARALLEDLTRPR